MRDRKCTHDPSPAAKMAIHLTTDSMKFEAIIEMIKVAQYSINFDKKVDWGFGGCYGYPAALLLLSIVDGIGAHVLGGGDDTKKHFAILNEKDWFDLQLTPNESETLRKGLRSRLVHQLYIDSNLILRKGTFEDKPVVTTEKGIVVLNLVPFFEKTKYCVEKMLNTIKLNIII